MSVEKLQQDILRCQHVISELTIKHYNQDNYHEIVTKIFNDIFKDYIEDHGKIKGIENQCPDKLEPAEKEHILETLTQHSHLPESSLQRIRAKLRINNQSL